MRVKSSGILPTREKKGKERLITKIMTRNYQQKLLGDIMSRKNVGIIGILAYPKIINCFLFLVTPVHQIQRIIVVERKDLLIKN